MSTPYFQALSIQAFDKVVDGTTTRGIIALADGQPVGSLDINDWHRDGGWVSTVNVAEAYRRQGIARLLFAQALADARQVGKTGLGLSVKSDNAAARALYESLGFRVCYSFDASTLAMTLHL